MAAPNIVNVTTITGKTALANATTVASNVVVNPASSNTVLKLNSIIVSNVDGTNAADVTVSILRASNSFAIASTVSVAADASLVVISKENTIYLEEGDAITCVASANNDLQIICSYEEIS